MTEPIFNAESVEGVPKSTRISIPFVPGRTDGIVALLSFVMGFLFIRWVLFSWQGWGVTLFTALFGCLVMGYVQHKGVNTPRSAWFWLIILQLTGLSYALWQANGLAPWRDLFLFCSAVYWVLSATEMTLLGRISDWLPLDFLHGLFVIPFRNFSIQYQSLAVLHTKRGASAKKFWPIALGLLISLIIMAAILPLLIQADSGGFTAITRGLTRHLRFSLTGSIELIIQILLALPTAAYLFALVAGSVHRRGSPAYQEEPVTRSINAFRILPTATINTVLGFVSGVYLIFIFSQLPYFFSAFMGARPAGWQVYSEYARNGFFELCSIAVINLTLITVANLSSRKTRRDSALLRAFSALLALLTMLLIATAFSKMALYINVYGLTVKRLLPCMFMAFLAVICAGIVALQKRQFSIMRLAAIVGAVMLCTLCLIDPDATVANYNANRYLAQTLPGFDVEVLHRAGPAGVYAAQKVFAQTQDLELRTALDEYLQTQYYRSTHSLGRANDTLQNALARQRLQNKGWHSTNSRPITIWRFK